MKIPKKFFWSSIHTDTYRKDSPFSYVLTKPLGNYIFLTWVANNNFASIPTYFYLNVVLCIF